MTDQRNLILAIVLSVGIILFFQYFYELPRMREQQSQQSELGSQQSETVTPKPATPGQDQGSVTIPGGVPTAGPDRAQALSAAPRLKIDNGRLHGSVAVVGNRIDDISLADYREHPDRSSKEIVLLSPTGSASPYFVEMGWVPELQTTVVPGVDTPWRVEGDGLGPGRSLRMTWDNGAGLEFQRVLELDSDFMLTVRRGVRNSGNDPVTLFPYGLISRWGTPKTMGFYILHEGPLGVLGGTLHEPNYDDLKEKPQEYKSVGGWLGITDKYWLTALVPQQNEEVTANFRHVMVGGQDRYQVDFLGKAVTLAAGQSAQSEDRIFVGAKEVDKLDNYEAQLGIPLFDRAVDFGWFYFLTKPFFHVLHFFNKYTGNYGVAILLLTLLVKAAFFPLANKSYRAMSQMKKLQPEMVKLRERYGDDKVKMNQELMALYKKEKVNPMAGCLPVIIQIPVFFALYKVLFVNIEMRHAPFFGWIKDLSAPDPTSLFNLFGLIPWDPPSFLMLGVWPIVMGVTMWLQQRLNPQPADPIQAKVMSFLPLMFVFLFATFPAGLVIYWAWNNLLSIAQQWVIMKKMGVQAG